MGLESAGKPEIAQQDAAAGSFQAEATGLLHAGQATEPAHEHDATIKPASPKQVLPKSSNDHTAELKPGMPGLNTDNFHQQTRDLLFQHDTHGVPIAFQPQVDITAVGLPQIHFDNGAQPDNGDNVRPQQLPPEGSERPQPQPEFTNHIVKHGDNLWKIARENLEQGASNRVVANYVHQIEADNPMHDPNLIMPGQIIKLRGYASATEHDTAHGAPGHNDNNRQPPPDTTHYKKSLPPDHTTYRKDAPPPKDQPHNDVQPLPQHDKPSNDTQRKPLPPVPEFVPLPSKNDSSDLPSKPSDNSEDLGKQSFEAFLSTNPEMQYEHAKVIEMAENHNNASEYRQFVHDLTKYEHSFGGLEESYRVKGKEQAEINKELSGIVMRAYKGVEKLYGAKAKDSLDRRWLDMAARETIHDAAEAPIDGNIPQGANKTCAANSVEALAYIKHSDKVISAVADLAITGKFTATDGSAVEIDNKPHGESLLPMQGNARDYPSALLQTALISLVLQKRDPRLSWGQQEPATGRVFPSDVMFIDGKVRLDPKTKKLETNPGLGLQDMAVMYSLLTGGTQHPIERGKPCDTGAACVGSFSEFEKLLQERREKGEFWTLAAVEASNKLFGNQKPGGHAILLSDYVPNRDYTDARIKYFNWWGRPSTNKIVPEQQIFGAVLNTQH